VRQFPEQCASCDRQIATLEICVFPDGTGAVHQESVG